MYSQTTKYTEILDRDMSEQQDERIGKSTTTTLEFGRPKFQATIPEHARRILGVTEDDLEYKKADKMDKVVVTAELTVEEVYSKDLSND